MCETCILFLVEETSQGFRVHFNELYYEFYEHPSTGARREVQCACLRTTGVFKVVWVKQTRKSFAVG